MLAGVPRAGEIFDVVFFVVLFVVLVTSLGQGTTLPALTHRLGLGHRDAPHALDSSALPLRPAPASSPENVADISS